MNIRQPLVSVITPVYNTEKYLSRCIESVLSQTYENIEYIIVDNCSDDGSFQIARRYAARDRRIRLVSNDKFLAIIANWNNSLKYISPQSKYCKFVHADDWLFPECIAKMVALGERYPDLGIISSFRLEENRVTLGGLKPGEDVIDGKSACRRVFRDGLNLFGSPTNVIYKSKFIRATRQFYDPNNIHADLEVCFRILQASDFGFVHQVLSFTRRHNESETSHNHFYNTHLVGTLTVLCKYGPNFLNRQEYASIFERRMKAYYFTIGRKMVKIFLSDGPAKMRDYLNYHKKAFSDLNIEFAPWRLGLAIILSGYNALVRKMIVPV